MNHSAIATSRRADASAMLAAAVFPSLAAWLYFVALTQQPTAVQQINYAAGKIIQFGFPLLWVLAVQRQRLHWSRSRAAGLIEAIAFGAAAFVVMLVGYYTWLRPSGALAGAGELVAKKVAGFGVDSPAKFVVLGLFYSLVHSLLEEYYWRWFVFGGLRRLMPLGPAILLSSLAFMAHHVIVLATYFGWFSTVTLVFSLGVAVGGAVWAWTYHRSQSLVGPWLSHLLVDAAIFVIGYDLIRVSTGM
jgi:uncharacterized protein